MENIIVKEGSSIKIDNWSIQWTSSETGNWFTAIMFVIEISVVLHLRVPTLLLGTNPGDEYSWIDDKWPRGKQASHSTYCL